MAEIHNNGSSKSSAKIPKIKFTKLFINGEFVDSVSGRTFETIDPSTEEVIANIAEGDKEDVDLAVKAARFAFDHGPWPRISGSERGRIMMKFVDLILENGEELAALEAIDAGKVFEQVKVLEMPIVAGVLRYYAGAADKIHGKTMKMANQLQGYTLHEPIGVVGHIIPWNFPVSMFFNKASPALAAGCTMIIKPAEQTPLSALYCAHLAKLAGIPDGVINVITGFGAKAGAAISSHMDIDCVSFTGSTQVGRHIMQDAATSNLKSLSLELGGKSPLIIFDDVDVDSVVNIALWGSFTNNTEDIKRKTLKIEKTENILGTPNLDGMHKCIQGEVCVASSRIFVQEGVYEEFITKFAKAAKEIIVGDPFDPITHQGPQVDKRQYEKVLSYIEHGKRQGATLLTGGKSSREKGYYIEPTIFTDVTDDMLIATDEIFGPVVSVFKFKTIEEAIARGNSTPYGLAAGIATKDLNIANTVSRSLRAGIIWINCYLAFDADAPFGGFKRSGFGKELGTEGLYKFLKVKSVITPVHDSPWL